MHCYICFTYMLIICSARPPERKELKIPALQKRSLFHDVIESLRIRTHLPEDTNLNEENNLYQNEEKYYENEQPQLPSDADFIPRRNDRLEMPSLKYRFRRSLENSTEDEDKNHEVVLYIETSTEVRPTKKPHKRPYIKNKEDQYENQSPMFIPFSNTMAGQSQIGDRESQMVVKPTVIVNLRGTVSHRDSDIRLEKKHNYTIPDMRGNVFNVKQEVNLYRTVAETRNVSNKNEPSSVKQEVKIVEKDIKREEDMMMCETSGINIQKVNPKGRKMDVLQILFSV